MTRRELLKYSAMTGSALAIAGSFSGLASPTAALAHGRRRTVGYGPLVPDPAGVLDLPEGFSYRILATGGNGYAEGFSTYADGQRVAGDFDGAASFRGRRGETIIVLNHELSASEADEAVPHTVGGAAVPTYDPAMNGGTSTIVLDRRGDVVSVTPSLAGTINNCAGGPTPWGTWLTCEENQSDGERPHGYLFEVDPYGVGTTAVPYTAMGRCNHEAVAIDPRTSDAFLTEDNGNGLLYKFEPNDRSRRIGSLGNGGALSAMKAAGLSRLGEVSTIGTTVGISWVAIPEPDRTGLNATLDDAVITRSTKLEGTWYAGGIVYFCSSYENVAGIEHVGQIWALDPKRDTITLVAYLPVGEPTFDSPDNITVAPNGQLILCEDGDGEQYLIGLDPGSGELWAFARNAMGENEFAGANFSPDGGTLFVSIQNPSTLFAITGPWSECGRRGRH